LFVDLVEVISMEWFSWVGFVKFKSLVDMQKFMRVKIRLDY
jgi:hypothetical protein